MASSEALTITRIGTLINIATGISLWYFKKKGTLAYRPISFGVSI